MMRQLAILSGHFIPVKHLNNLLLLLCTLLLAPLSHAQRNAVFASDSFGYATAEAASCPQQWLDISTTGTALNLQAAGAADADDDGAALINLTEEFEFYGKISRSVVVSTNGYLSFAAGLNEENGGDFSNDCPMPAIPDNGAQTLNRIAVLHDDLAAGVAGEIYHQYQSPCLRAGQFPGEACSIVQWQNWDYHDNPGSQIAFQILLYHQSRSLVLQYQNVAQILSGSASTGLQNHRLTSAHMLACNDALALPASGAWCVQHPLPAEQLLGTGFE